MPDAPDTPRALTATADGYTLRVWAKPRASKSRIVGVRVDPSGRAALEVALASPPVDGAANSELLSFLAKKLGVPRSRLLLETGATSRDKVVSVKGQLDPEVIENLAP